MSQPDSPAGESGWLMLYNPYIISILLGTRGCPDSSEHLPTANVECLLSLSFLPVLP